MAKKISGRCKCGQIAYSGELVDAPMFRCYCRDCQQLTGAGHSEPGYPRWTPISLPTEA